MPPPTAAPGEDPLPLSPTPAPGVSPGPPAPESLEARRHAFPRHPWGEPRRGKKIRLPPLPEPLGKEAHDHPLGINTKWLSFPMEDLFAMHWYLGELCWDVRPGTGVSLQEWALDYEFATGRQLHTVNKPGMKGGGSFSMRTLGCGRPRSSGPC